MGTLVPRFMGLGSCRIAELHRRRRQLRHAVAAGVDEAHERLPVYSFPLSWAFYCNPGLVPEYNITQPISLLVNLRSSRLPLPSRHGLLYRICRPVPFYVPSRPILCAVPAFSRASLAPAPLVLGTLCSGAWCACSSIFYRVFGA